MEILDTHSQGEIAERMGVSQMSVSRKLTRLLGSLRAEAITELLQPVAST
ncbi:sigma factor-like helix-turn-helix DNA-binding protein [Nocardia salmonicida]